MGIFLSIDGLMKCKGENRSLHKGSHGQRGEQGTGNGKDAQGHAVILFRLLGLSRLGGAGAAGSGGALDGPVGIHGGIPP